MNFGELAVLVPAQVDKLVRQIGDTPLVPIPMVLDGKTYQVHLKLEGMNPTGSMKDRTGYALIQDLEERGVLNEDAVVIESSSGNLGVALALICKARGYRLVVIADPKTTHENIVKLRTLGAEVEIVDQPDEHGGYLLSRLKRVEELCQQYPNYVWPNQYVNTANPRIHYTHTGPEIYKQMQEQVDAVFVPVSTGGTLAGIGCFFREVSPATRVIGVDAVGSVVFSTCAAPRKLTGIGSSRPSSFISSDLYDAHILVGDLDAFAFCHALYAANGIKAGGSSGAVLAACARYLKAHPELINIVCVCADRGENYTSTIFNEYWLQQIFQHNVETLEAAQVILPGSAVVSNHL